MPATTITSSPNIASLDSKVNIDLCGGYFYIDATPTVYIAGGASSVLGFKVQITNPFNVVVRAFPSDYDATSATLPDGMDTVIQFAVPTQAGNYQYGTYKVEIQMTDADGTKYIVSKTISVCNPDPNDKTKKFGKLGAKLSGICKDGKVYVLVDAEPTYKGYDSASAVRDFTLDYPTGSGKPSEDTQQRSFNVQLFEGVYKIAGTSCALYDYGDNVSVKVNYKVDFSKPIICSLDECCVFTGLSALNDKVNSDCSDAEKKETQNRIQKATLLLNMIRSASECGEDASDSIFELEDVLGMTCSCDFNNGTPLINTSPTGDFLVEGCNVSSSTAGLTTVFTIENYSYAVSVPDNGGVLSITPATLAGCEQTQVLSINVGVIYTQVKNLALSDSDHWANVVKLNLNTLDATCLDLTTQQLALISYKDLIQKIIDKSCAGGNCSATIDTFASVQVGGDAKISWTQTGSYFVDIFLDSVYQNTVLSSVTEYTLTGKADGVNHTYQIIPKCDNGSVGTGAQGSFGYAGCPTIAPPTVSTSNVSNVGCPFDLTSVVSGLPTGITGEWHTANNTLASTLVANDKAVSDGIYYVYATNGAKCYSTGVKVTVTCGIASSCTAPQSLSATPILGGVKVSFSSAVYPPPSNSYTVKRKAGTDADVDANYTTMPTPTFNASTNKWEVTDVTAANNTLYTYKAISNCTSSSPSILYDFAKVSCPTVTLTSTETQIGYSFSGSGGQIDQYVVDLLDASGITILDSDTFTPAFASPITGLFDYLTQNTTYKVRVTAYIGANAYPCTVYSKKTLATNNISWNYENNVGAGGKMRITVNSAIVVDTTTNNSGTLNAPIGSNVAVYVYTTVPGTAVIDISGPYMSVTSTTHIATDNFTVAAGSYVIEGRSNP